MINIAASQRLYVAMAATIKREVNACRPFNKEFGMKVLESLVINLCNDLTADNHNFKKDKFLRACGLGHLAHN